MRFISQVCEDFFIGIDLLIDHKSLMFGFLLGLTLYTAIPFYEKFNIMYLALTGAVGFFSLAGLGRIDNIPLVRFQKTFGNIGYKFLIPLSVFGIALLILAILAFVLSILLQIVWGIDLGDIVYLYFLVYMVMPGMIFGLWVRSEVRKASSE